MKIEKLTPWIPLMIAAGYFLFLAATWANFIRNSKTIQERLDTVLGRLENGVKPNDSDSV